MDIQYHIQLYDSIKDKKRKGLQNIPVIKAKRVWLVYASQITTSYVTGRMDFNSS